MTETSKDFIKKFKDKQKKQKEDQEMMMIKKVSHDDGKRAAGRVMETLHYAFSKKEGQKCSTLNSCFSTDFHRKIVKF